MTDGGNAYTLPYVAQLVNLPFNASDFDAEVQSIPFYQMVLHGSLSYSGPAFNRSVDPDINLLRMVEVGATPYFELITGENSLLRGTDYEAKLYSVSSGEWLDKVTALTQQLSDYYSSVANATIVKHEQLTTNVFRTTYSNGVSAVVNYGNTAADVQGVEIAAKSYHIFEKE